ncbi:hypothetical protein [Pseudoalteromonas tetraodonis]|uniref:hypothetical protein n=1 Tax=Pseudoalteromonas tetraodonis TaxID=43659 RepID=UPI003001D393
MRLLNRHVAAIVVGTLKKRRRCLALPLFISVRNMFDCCLKEVELSRGKGSMLGYLING